VLHPAGKSECIYFIIMFQCKLFKVTAILNVRRRILESLACRCLLHSVEWVNSYEGSTAG